MLRRFVIALVCGGVFNVACALPAMDTSRGPRSTEAGAAGRTLGSNLANAGRNAGIGGNGVAGNSSRPNTSASGSRSGIGGDTGNSSNGGASASAGMGGAGTDALGGASLGGVTSGVSSTSNVTVAGKGNAGAGDGGASGANSAIVAGAFNGGATAAAGTFAGGTAGRLNSGGSAGAVAGALGAGGYAPITTAPSDCQGEIDFAPDLATALRSKLGISKLTWEALKDLTDLDVTGNSVDKTISTLNGVQCLTGLKKLSIVACRVENISALGKNKRLMNLTALDLSENLISDLAPIGALENLVTFIFGHNYNQVSSDNTIGITAIKLLSKLETFYAFASAINSIDGLQNHPALKSLELSSNALTTCQGLGTLSKLQYLGLGQNYLTSADGLNSLPAITELDLSNQGSVTRTLTSIGAIATLTTLQKLDIGYNHVLGDISAVAGMTALVDLDASVCGLADTKPLKDLTNLATLNLANNALTSVAELGSLPKLETVDLSYNPDLKDVSPLVANSAIAYPDYVYLTNTSVCKGTIADLSSLANKLGDGTDNGVKVGHLTLPCTL